jgi:TRAP-type uncharacterized transport system fused permease subunit
MILGGPVAYVIWTGAIAALALVAFAAAIEGYLFGPMHPALRLAVVPATIAVFHPVFAVEATGAAVLVAVLAMNAVMARGAEPVEG